METSLIVLITILVIAGICKHIIWLLFGIFLIKDRIEEKIENRIERQVREKLESQNTTVS